MMLWLSIRRRTLTGGIAGVAVLAGLLSPVGARAALTVEVGFSGISLDQERNATFHEFGDVPDVQVAAGTPFTTATGAVITPLVETVQDSLAVYNVATTPPMRVAFRDLRTVFHLCTTSCTTGAFLSGPQLLFDSGRYFSAARVDQCSSTGCTASVLLAVTANPMGSWHVYTIGSPSQGGFFGDPNLGVSNQMVAVSWDTFTSQVFGSTTTALVNKSQLLSGAASPTIVDLTPSNGIVGVSPVRMLNYGTDTDQYLVYVSRGFSGQGIGVITIHGMPASSGPTPAGTVLSIDRLTTPPDAQQPGLGPLLNTGWGFAILSGVWQAGRLYTSINDGCVPQTPTAHDSTERACLRIDEITTSSAAGPALVQDFDMSWMGHYLYYGALATDVTGNLIAGFTTSSAMLAASGAAAEQPAGTSVPLASTLPQLPVVPIIVRHGSGTPYGGSNCFCGKTVPWGDYESATLDPNNPTQVWVGTEYSAANSTDSFNWGTGLGRVTG